MKRVRNISLLLTTALSCVLSSCAYAPRSPVPGLIYSDTQGAVAISSNQAGTRMGRACATSILGLIATGDASIETARRTAGITLITTVEDKSFSVLGVYAEYCTIVRGR